jgi:hypothetical protein
MLCPYPSPALRGREAAQPLNNEAIPKRRCKQALGLLLQAVIPNERRSREKESFRALQTGLACYALKDSSLRSE